MNPAVRPPRRMPSAGVIARHWGTSKRRCMRCGLGCRPDRAHIVDRQAGGLDGVQNLWLLCPECHDEMPSVQPDQVPGAWRWLRLNSRVDEAIAMGFLYGPAVHVLALLAGRRATDVLKELLRSHMSATDEQLVATAVAVGVDPRSVPAAEAWLGLRAAA